MLLNENVSQTMQIITVNGRKRAVMSCAKTSGNPQVPGRGIVSGTQMNAEKRGLQNKMRGAITVRSRGQFTRMITEKCDNHKILELDTDDTDEHRSKKDGTVICSDSTLILPF